MRRGRTLIFVFLIIIIGLVVAFVAFRQFISPSTPQTQQQQFVDIYYASQPIPQGGKITADVLATMKIPQENLIASMFATDELDVLTNNKVAKFPLDQGVVITESMVNDASAGSSISGPTWASLIPTGMSAMTIPTDRLKLAGYAVNNGAHVNINACFLFVDVDPTFQSILPNLTAALTGTGFGSDGLPVLTLGVAASGAPQGRLELDPSLQQPYLLVPSERQRPRMVCQMLLQDVIVMRVGNFPLDPNASLTSAPAAQTASTDPQAQPAAPVAPDIVTLLVSPQDSITLSYLIGTDAEITLTLRNPSDQARQATEAATLQFLLSQYNIPVPAKLPYSLDPYTTSFGNLNLALPNDTTTVPSQ
jgi:Flp pilus assembly protein CpaB